MMLTDRVRADAVGEWATWNTNGPASKLPARSY